MRLLDAEGNEIAANDNSDSLNSRIGYSATTRSAPSSSPPRGWVENAGTYRLSAGEFIDDVPGSTATTASLTIDTPTEGTIEFVTDQDWYRVEIVAGLTSSSTSKAPILEPARSATPTCGCSTPTATRSAATEFRRRRQCAARLHSYNGRGSVRLRRGQCGNSTGSYRLSAREFVSDVPDNIATTATLTVGTTTASTIDLRPTRTGTASRSWPGGPASSTSKAPILEPARWATPTGAERRQRQRDPQRLEFRRRRRCAARLHRYNGRGSVRLGRGAK